MTRESVSSGPPAGNGTIIVMGRDLGELTHADEAHLAGVPALAVVGEVLVEAQPREAPAQQARQRRLARLDRLAPKVREPVLVAGDRLAVDQAGAHLEPVDGHDNERVAPRPVVPFLVSRRTPAKSRRAIRQ